MTLPNKLAFVDLETTGARFPYDRVIEIGIVRVENNEIVQTYNQLLNPERHLPPEIQMLTGITAKDLDNQPTFHEVKDTVHELLQDCLFVAHNARFDYGFLKHEFNREEISFAPKHCCTVKLSRNLFPTERHHNLDAVMQRLALECKQRHRAFDDAHVLYQFYTKIQKLFPLDQILEALKVAMNKPSLPGQLHPSFIDNLPEEPGVYIFWGPDERSDGDRLRAEGEDRGGSDKQKAPEVCDAPEVPKGATSGALGSFGSSVSSVPSPLVPLYIGKSKNIRERVLSHFSADIRSSTEMQMSQQVQRIETITTAGELGALFTESQLVKKMLPLYNKQLRRQSELIALFKQTDASGYPSVAMQVLDKVAPSQLDSFIGFFRSRKQAKSYLGRMVKEYQLCEKLLGLEKTSTSCFSYRLGICKGACTGKEPVMKYLVRFLTAFAGLKVKPWPFKGPIAIEEENVFSKQKEYFLVDKWCYIGSVKVDGYGVSNDVLQETTFDVDTYNILRRFFNKSENVRHIKLLSQLPFTQINSQFAM